MITKHIEYRREDCIERLQRYNKRASYKLMMKYLNDDVPTIESDFDYDS